MVRSSANTQYGFAIVKAARMQRQLSLRLVIFVAGLFPLALMAFPARSQPAADASQVQAIYQRGYRALQQRDLAGARTAFEEVVKLSPQSPEVHNSLGWVLLLQGELEDAVTHLRKAIELKSDFQQAHANLAQALAQRG